MAKLLKSCIRPALFILGGGIVGILYYYLFGCQNGCAITSSPVSTAAYIAVIGYLLSVITDKKKG